MDNINYIIQEFWNETFKIFEDIESRDGTKGELAIFVVSNVKWNISKLFRLWVNRESNKSLTFLYIIHVIMKIMSLKFV